MQIYANQNVYTIPKESIWTHIVKMKSFFW